MADKEDDERRDRNQRAVAGGVGALLGSAAGPIGSIVGAVLGPLLEPLIRGVWNELSDSGRRRQQDLLESAIHAGIPIEEMEERINASERTQLLTGLALGAATRTAWEDKVRTLGRSLASGLLAGDNAEIDTEQMIITAIADIEGPQLAMLELMVAWRPGRTVVEPVISGPLNLPEDSHSQRLDRGWSVAGREFTQAQIAYGRPNLAALAPSLLGTLQRHGLVVQNDKTGDALKRLSDEWKRATAEQYAREGRAGGFRPSGPPRVSSPELLAPEPTWSPTELGEQVYLRFRDAGTELDDDWSSGPAVQQEQ